MGPSVDCPADNGNGNAYGAWEHNWKCIPQAFSEVENLTIDSTIVEGTPHWIFLAAGTREKQALLDYIDSAIVSPKQKADWTEFIRNMWKEHPVGFDNSTGNPTLVPGKSTDGFTLTPAENATFRAIEQYIAEDMENIQAGVITPKWYAEPTHRMFMETALQPEIIPSDLKTFAANAAPEPDYWDVNKIPGYQQINHGYVPGIGGLAPNNFATQATSAKQKFSSHDYSGAFTDMGYASHFITDLGNPYHTPPVQLIPLEYIDSPYSEITFPNSQMILNYGRLHNKYEEMVANHWSMFYTGNQDRYDIFEPISSANAHGTASWAMSYPLIYDCYWHFVFDRNFDFSSDPAIVGITQNRVTESMKNIRGLVRYVTGGQYPTLTITSAAGPGGSISPSGAVSVRYGESQTFTISPNSGYIIDKILVDGNPVTQNPYAFSSVTADHTISATFKQTGGSGSPSTEWDWSIQGWGDWNTASVWGGNIIGPCSEYGPVMVNNHGEYGANVNLNYGYVISDVERTFSASSGDGWNTLTLVSRVPGSDVPGGRWMKIYVDGNLLYYHSGYSSSDPANANPGTITVNFPMTKTPHVTIMSGQNPAWGPRFYMEFYSAKVSYDGSSLLTTTGLSSGLPDSDEMVTNATVSFTNVTHG